ncbi:unnamed protein product [Angiostrongylus costaricensis]|uniref:Piwi domain-containing protein n=1 Tax=Angiostrongylus costaricensis TaxID=334426 RepID=A0A158PFC3_ANGCS|nr:unnamed protein product [Angiostrongylus costaricensis]
MNMSLWYPYLFTWPIVMCHDAFLIHSAFSECGRCPRPMRFPSSLSRCRCPHLAPRSIMDLLDNITSLMTKTEKERAGRSKKTAEVSRFDENGKASNKIVVVINPGRTSGASTATPSTSSAVPKVVTMSHPSSSAVGRPTKHRQELGIESRGGCDFLIHRRLPIEMNGVYMDLSRAPEFVRRYHIDVSKVVQGKQKDVTRGPKQDFSTQQRRRALFALFKQLVTDNLDHFGEDRSKHVYDLGNTFYSIGCRITEQDGEVMFKMKPSEIVSSSAREFLPRRCQQLLFTVQYVGQIRIKDLRQNEDEGYLREACRFFEVLTSQYLYDGDSYNFANKFFESSVDKDVKIGEGKCVKSGFEKNVRMVSKGGDQATPVLQVVSLIVVTTHMETNRRFYIHGIEEAYAGKQFFETPEGKISVEQYFQEKYKRSLRFPRLPLATERKSANMLNYYPLELLVIEPGQRVSTRKLTGALTERMVQQARILPHEMRKDNRRQLAWAGLAGDDNEYLSSFRVRIFSEFVTSEGKVLAAPEITYKTGSLQPDGRGRLTWKLTERSQFFRPATVEAVSIVILDKAVHRNQASDFYHALARMGRSRGMEIRETNVKIHEMYSELNSRIEEHFRSVAGKVSMVMFVTKIRKDPVHDFIKLLEARYKVVTQHVSASTVLFCCQNRARIIENLLLKFNVKCGGLNHMISSTPVALRDRTSQRDMNGRLFNGKMFVAFELSHPAALSFYDRQNKKAAKEPTVVGFAYSKTLATDYTGCWWYQQPHLHNIQYIRDHFNVAFTCYFEENKSLPAEVVVYRSGASEGEFNQIKEEVRDIRAVAESMRDHNGGKPYRPRITVIVVQSRSNYRITPASSVEERSGRLRAAELNVPSGTCVDADIVNLRFREFIMTSQQASIGTSRPVRYTIIVEDKPERPLYEVEHMTHFLCHGHQVSILNVIPHNSNQSFRREFLRFSLLPKTLQNEVGLLG